LELQRLKNEEYKILGYTSPAEEDEEELLALRVKKEQEIQQLL